MCVSVCVCAKERERKTKAGVVIKGPFGLQNKMADNRELQDGWNKAGFRSGEVFVWPCGQDKDKRIEAETLLLPVWV